MSDKPLISCIMPVYNCCNFLKQAIESVLEQSYSNFELIVIDDCSTDNSLQVAQSFCDKRITILQNAQNRGIVYSLNKGLAVARGDYIARMDGDDICQPERFEKQLDFLMKNKDISLVSCWFELIGDGAGIIRYDTDPDSIKIKLLYSLQCLHPGWMFRKEILIQHSLSYREEYKYAEDYKFLSDASQYVRLSNVPCVLMKYRISSGQSSAKKQREQDELRRRIVSEQIERFHCKLSKGEFESFFLYANGTKECDMSSLNLLESAYCKMIESNEKHKTYDPQHLLNIFHDSFYHICYFNAMIGKKQGLYFLRSRFMKKKNIKENIKIILRYTLSLMKQCNS